MTVIGFFSTDCNVCNGKITRYFVRGKTNPHEKKQCCKHDVSCVIDIGFLWRGRILEIFLEIVTECPFEVLRERKRNSSHFREEEVKGSKRGNKKLFSKREIYFLNFLTVENQLGAVKKIMKSKFKLIIFMQDLNLFIWFNFKYQFFVHFKRTEILSNFKKLNLLNLRN